MPDVVVVGGGVVGASVAWHLARSGVRDVTVVDRCAAPGEGSTGRATGGFRAQFGTGINVRLSLLAREKLLRFRDEVGADPGYEPCGYLWLASSAEELDVLRAAQRVQHAAGLRESRIVASNEIAVLNPKASLDGVIGGAFCPIDGFVRPLEILRGYLEGARRLGVSVRFGAEVVGFRRAAHRIEAVRLRDADLPCGTAVNAAGAWAAPLGRLAGVDVAVAPLRRQVACTVPCDALPGDMPMTIWLRDGFHLRVRDGRVLLLHPTDEREGSFSTEVDRAWLAGVQQLAAARVPALAGVALDEPRCWAGLYEVSPDRHALVGTMPGCENFVLANGSSGHGVMHAPALGVLAAEFVVHGRARSLDVKALRPSRFAEGEPIKGPALL
jgi:sarcosine oxidase subunit beta